MTVVAVVLAGGTGTRLYPASSPETPKQFRAVGPGEGSLLTRAVRRAETFADEVVVLTRETYADRVPEHAPDAEVLLEPEPKDTGPALAYAAFSLRERYEDPVLVCLPSDAHVGDDAAFADDVERAVELARERDGLVTLGVEPTYAATGYGYLKPGEAVDRGGKAVEAGGGLEAGRGYAVERFVEKPDAGAAARYREHGYLWNAGTFVWTPGAFLSAARDSALAPLVDALAAGDPEPFDTIASVSVDHGVLEGADDVFVVRTDVEWDDLGTWDALDRVLAADEDGNVVDGNALALDAEGCVLATDADSHVSVVGVSDLVVAAYGERVLVVPKSEAERVREVFAELEAGDAF
ncbi:MAG: sugar phosphate nucleotidyltransferase [Haloarculaceae archaeon]